MRCAPAKMADGGGGEAELRGLSPEESGCWKGYVRFLVGKSECVWFIRLTAVILFRNFVPHMGRWIGLMFASSLLCRWPVFELSRTFVTVYKSQLPPAQNPIIQSK